MRKPTKDTRKPRHGRARTPKLRASRGRIRREAALLPRHPENDAIDDWLDAVHEPSMALSGADRDAFLAAIDRKPEPTPRFIAALKRHRQLFGDRR